MKYTEILSGRNIISFRIKPEGLKFRNYKNLEDITRYFTSKELKGAVISILLNSVVVGHLDTKKVLAELK